MTTKTTFTLAELARELKLDPKFARRKFRANAAKAKPEAIPAVVKTPGSKNVRWEWDQKHKAAVSQFLKG